MGQHRSASGSVLLGLDGFEVLAAQVVDGEWQLEVQTTATMVGCGGCGMRAEAHGRRMARVRDLPIGGRPVVLAWSTSPDHPDVNSLGALAEGSHEGAVIMGRPDAG